MTDLKPERIGVLCSGGDCSGMNPCVRAVVRAGVSMGIEVFGVYRGYQGLIDNDIRQLGPRDVSGIINRGGTIIKSARCMDFMEAEGRAKAAANLSARRIDGLVVIGGDGSFHGAHELAQETGIRTVGIPGTIDNDIAGTDLTIGYDTAVNVAMQCLDNIRDTAASHDRLFVVEVMGRHAGFIAMEAGLATGAEAILVPEQPTDIDRICQELVEGRQRGKSSSIVVVAEGDDAGGAFDIAAQIEQRIEMKSRVTVLGHLQRGGSPTATDRVLAGRLGVAAIRQLCEGATDVMVGVIREEIAVSPLENSWTKKKVIPQEYYDIQAALVI